MNQGDFTKPLDSFFDLFYFKILEQNAKKMPA